MARNSGGMMIPTPGGGGLKKFLAVVALLAILALIIKHPVDAAHRANGLGDFFGGAIDSVASFFEHLG